MSQKSRILPILTVLSVLLVASAAQGERESDSSSADPSPSSASQPPSTLGIESINELLRRTMDDPGTAERRRTMLRALVKQIYADFVAERRLKPTQAKEFMELLADREMIDMQDSINFLANDPDDPSSPQSVAQLAPIASAEVKQKLKALLSREDYARFEEYEKSASPRVAMAELRQQLALNSEPLNENQISFLQRVLLDEWQRSPTVYDPRGPGTFREKAHLAAAGDNGAQYLKAQAEMDQRVLERAKKVLSSEQLEALATFQQQYVEAEKSGIELKRKVIAPEASAPTSP